MGLDQNVEPQKSSADSVSMAAKGIQQYYCLYCADHIFMNKRNLTKHFVLKHKSLPKVTFISGSETRQCVHCKGNYTLMTEKKLLDHSRSCVKNPERAKNQAKMLMSCPICDLKMTRKDNLKVHIARFHSDQPTENIINATTTPGGSLDLDLELSEFYRGTLDPSKLINSKEMIRYDTKIRGTNATKSSFCLSELAIEIGLSGLFFQVIETVFNYLFKLHGASDGAHIHTTLESEYLSYPIETAINTSGKDFQIQNLLDRLDQVVQSYKNLPAQSDLTLSITTVNAEELLNAYYDVAPIPPTVSGRKNLNPKHFSHIFDYLEKKKGFLDIAKFQTERTDKSCLPLSIGVALHFKTPFPAIKQTYWFRHACDFPIEVLTHAKNIYIVLGQEFNTDIQLSNINMNKIQLWLSEFFNNTILQIFQMNSNNYTNVVQLFHGKSDSAKSKPTTIQILVANEHAGLITSEKEFFCAVIFCDTCSNFVKKRNKQHKCLIDKCCHLCLSAECKGEKHARLKLCLDCNRRFKDSTCYEFHKTIKSQGSVCALFCKCNKCFQKVARSKLATHLCGIRRCQTCKSWVPVNTPNESNHVCYISPNIHQRANAYNEPIHLIYDIECKRIENKLVPIMLIVFRSCPNCFENDDPAVDTACCGKRCHVFKGDNCMTSSVEYIFFTKFKKQVIAIAHFGSGFDSLYLLETLLSLGHIPNIIPKGNKILKLEYNGVICIDSLMFFHAGLAKLPKLFDFRQQKSFFPHDFHPKLPFSYNGPWPEPRLFPASYSAEDKPEFDNWYIEQRKLYPLFNYMKQLETYCLRDVLVLHLAVSKFRSLVLQYAQCEPFQVAITLASLTSYVFRLRFVPEGGKIAVLSEHQDLRDRSQSKIGACFLRWLQETKYPDLKFAYDGVEKQIGPYKLDGFSQSKNLGVEFYGCHWHSCLKSEHGISPLTKHPSFPYYTYEEAHQFTLDRERYLLDHGLDHLETFWECEVNKIHDFNVWLTETKILQVISNPINSLREALYGGRVEVSLPLVEICTPNERDRYVMKYKDANHLYPSVMLKCPFPTGHPTIVNSWNLENYGRGFSVEDCDKYFGIIKVQIMYPYDAPMLFHGILPFHNKDKKLIFGLCAACAEENRQNQFCDHESQNDRSWVGTYCSTELKIALENNYRILRVFQILKFDQISSSIFTKYMICFLKLKFAATGWPKEYSANEETKKIFLKELYELDQILLDQNEIHDPSNIALKTLSKFFLNALWGKIAENREKSTTDVHFISTIDQWAKLLENSTNDLVSMSYLDNAETFIVETKKKSDFIEPSAISNAVIGSFVTSHARSRLTDNLLKLSHRALYCDTDSVIYYLRQGIDTDPIKTGPFSHQWKDEVPAGLKNFAGLCPKNYIFETNDGNCKWTCKGLSLTSTAAKSFNFNIAKHYLIERSPELSSLFYDKISDPEIRKRVKRQHDFCVRERNITPLVFDDGINISRNWKVPGGAFVIDDKRTKIITAKFDKRTVFRDSKLMLDSIVKIRSVPFGTTAKAFNDYCALL